MSEVDGLTLNSVTLNRSGLTVCRDISLRAPAGEVTVIIGANGAGKTTLLEGIAGVLPTASGDMRFEGRSMARLPLHRRAALGIGLIDQARSVFTKLTVAQNIAVVDRSKAALARVFDEFPLLEARRDTPAGRLSGGEQQMLLIARALTARPRMLLIDELSLGLAPSIVADLMRRVQSLAASGIGVVLVEQYAELALSIGHTAHVLDQGRIVRSGPAQDLLRDHTGRQDTYLGREEPPSG